MNTASFLNAYGYDLDGEGLICPSCASNPLYTGLVVEVETIGYPDGYTCAECGTEKKSDLEETEELCDECGVPMSIHEETKGMDN